MTNEEIRTRLARLCAGWDLLSPLERTVAGEKARRMGWATFHEAGEDAGPWHVQADKRIAGHGATIEAAFIAAEAALATALAESAAKTRTRLEELQAMAARAGAQ